MSVSTRTPGALCVSCPDQDEHDVAVSNRLACPVLPSLTLVGLIERTVRDAMLRLLLGLREEAVLEAIVLLKLKG